MSERNAQWDGGSDSGPERFSPPGRPYPGPRPFPRAQPYPQPQPYLQPQPYRQSQPYPYPPPASPWQGAGVPLKPPYGVALLGGWACGLLGAAAGLYATTGVLGLLDEEAAQTFLFGLSSVLLLAVIPVFLVWLHQARHNIEHLDPYRWAGPRRLGPGWAVGSWFVPVGFLWLPLQVVLDVWWGTAEPVSPRRVPRLLVGWWLCWLLSWFTGVRLTSTTAHTDGVRLESHQVLIVPGATPLSAFFAAAAAVLLLLLIRRVSLAQSSRLGR